jgi:predicted nucleotidyltransferase
MINSSMKVKIGRVAKVRGLELVVLFGSNARGTEHATSDIDIAVFASNSPNISLLAEEIGDCLGRNDVEVADLSGASPFLMRAVAEDGIVLYESKKNFFEKWKIYARNIWFDTAWLRARQRKSLKSWAINYETKNV